MIPVILCGGSGTRLWPVSRANYPKQFCEFFDQSFLLTTYNRLKSINTPWVITLDSMKSLTEKTIPIPDDQLIIEPLGKNTAPAIALLCYKMSQSIDKNSVIGVFPADHLIFNEKTFYKVLELANNEALNGKIVTLGVQPNYPSTAFGYIEVDNSDKPAANDKLKAYKVKSFREKPSEQKAQEYIKQDNFFWNAGIFVFKLSTMIQAFENNMPDLWSKVTSINIDNLDQVYANLSSISIDYGIMEKANNISCIPADLGWSDVGSWDEVARLFEEAPNLKSQSKASVYSYKSSSNFVYSVKNKTIGLSNVEDLIIVDTPDSLLVTKKGESQSVKDLQSIILESASSHINESFYEKRPWGSFEILSKSSEYKVKKVTLLPHKSISYQSHNQREESWVIVSGVGEVTLNDKKQSVKKNDTITILRKTKHKISNTSDDVLVLIEVQTGDYFGEDDIERFE